MHAHTTTETKKSIPNLQTEQNTSSCATLIFFFFVSQWCALFVVSLLLYFVHGCLFMYIYIYNFLNHAKKKIEKVSNENLFHWSLLVGAVDCFANDSNSCTFPWNFRYKTLTFSLNLSIIHSFLLWLFLLLLVFFFRFCFLNPLADVS